MGELEGWQRFNEAEVRGFGSGEMTGKRDPARVHAFRIRTEELLVILEPRGLGFFPRLRLLSFVLFWTQVLNCLHLNN